MNLIPSHFSHARFCSCLEAILPEKYVKYKVTISEYVIVTEFNDRYEIIDVDGKIYTIREKSDGEP